MSQGSPCTRITRERSKEISVGMLCDFFPAFDFLPRLCGLPSWGPTRWGSGPSHSSRPWLWAVLVLLRHFPSLLSAVMFLLVMGATLVFPLRWCSGAAEQWVTDGSLWWKSCASHRVPYRKCSVLIWSSQKAALRLWVNKLLHNAFFQFYFECFIQKPISEARLSWHTLWEAGAGRLPQTILGSLWNTVLRGKKSQISDIFLLKLVWKSKTAKHRPKKSLAHCCCILIRMSAFRSLPIALWLWPLCFCSAGSALACTHIHHMHPSDHRGSKSLGLELWSVVSRM